MSLRDRFRENAVSEIHINWDTEFTIEDIIYISLLPSKRVSLSSDFYINFDDGDDNETGNYMINIKTDERDLDYKLLLFVLISAQDRSYVDINYRQNRLTMSYEFQPEFLQKCWELAIIHKVDHEKFGTAVKAIGYKVCQDYSEFEQWYLNGTGNIRSARN